MKDEKWYRKLNKRQRKMLALILAGVSTQMIADTFDLTYRSASEAINRITKRVRFEKRKTGTFQKPKRL